MKKGNELVTFVRECAKWAQANNCDTVPLCTLTALLGEYDKVCEELMERPKAVKCNECRKSMTADCLLRAFDSDGNCTGGPCDDFYCALGEKEEP